MKKLCSVFATTILCLVFATGCSGIKYHRVIDITLTGENIRTPYGTGQAKIWRCSEIKIGGKKYEATDYCNDSRN